MIRRVTIAVIFALAARAARANDVSARALLAYQNYDFGVTSSSGFRQTYDLRLDRALTRTASFRLLFRGDDFRGSTSTTFGPASDSHTRQIQPIGEFLLNTDTFRVQARHDFLDTSSTHARRDSSQTIERTSAQLRWEPVSLPTLTLLGQRAATDDSAGMTGLVEENATALLEYAWRGLTTSGEARYSSAVDPRAGYERSANGLGASVGYAAAPLGGRLAIAADVQGRMTETDERAIGGDGRVPVPVPLTRALFGVDDTPSDNRDHPLSPYPGLRDGNLNASSGISLGPDAVSFQNFAADIGRTERVDEFRVVVRDANGNPLRNGGGPVTWDAYTSEDGQVWTLIAATSATYNASLAYYSITFAETTVRWVKVVNFGVNADTTLVTEIELYDHVEVGSTGIRSGTQQLVNATTSISYRPVDRLTLSYVGVYSSLEQQLAARPDLTSRSLEHVGGIGYAFTRTLGARAQYIRRDAEGYGSDDTADVISTFVDYTPTRRLRFSLELGRQTQTMSGDANTIDTRALHVYGQVYRSWSFNLDGGTETQTIARDGSTSDRMFLSLTSGAQLYRSLRLQLTGAMQQVETNSLDPAVLLLGPQRDNRAAAEFIWRAGRPLLISTRVGWVSSLAMSGFTQRYRIEWYPFADGAISIGGSYDEDIDPMTNRRARRAIFNPRWLVNGWATFDINYTSVSNQYNTITNEQRTLFATLTLSR